MILTVQSISAVTRSIEGGALEACPILERAPLIWNAVCDKIQTELIGVCIQNKIYF